VKECFFGQENPYQNEYMQNDSKFPVAQFNLL